MKKLRIYILFFFIIFTAKLNAVTISSSVTKTSSTTVNEDYTINSGVNLFFLNHQKGLRVKSGNIKIINRGYLKSYVNDEESNPNQTITGVGGDGAYDLKIYNYGTIYNTGSSAIFVPNSDQDNDGDGIGPYIYNEGTIKSSNQWSIRFHGSDKTKIDNYGDIVADSTQHAIMGYEDNDTIINNYADGLISANGSGGIATKTSDAQASNRTTINNWGTIKAEWDSVELGQNSTLNNYGKIIVNNTSYSTKASIQLQNDNNTVNLFDGTVLVGIIDADTNSATGSILNLDLCSSYYFRATGTLTVNNNSGCGELVYSNNYIQAASLLYQSVADEIVALRVDHINEVFDYSNKNINENKEFGFFSKSYSDRDNGVSIDKFASFQNNAVIGFPLNNEKYNAHQIFSFSSDKLDFLNLNVSSSSFQTGFLFEDLNFFADKKIGLKTAFGYHKHKSDRIKLNNQVASGKENINNSYDSFSTIIGSQIQDGNIKINLDTSFERSPNYIEDKDVTWNSRLIGQLMGDITYDLKKNLNKNFSFNPELTFGGRTLFLGKNQKYRVAGRDLTFNGGVQEDAFAKFSLNASYSFLDNTNLFIKTSAKKTTEDQETYSLDLAFKGIF